jgi:flagellar biosynthetic protein FlhB
MLVWRFWGDFLSRYKTIFYLPAMYTRTSLVNLGFIPGYSGGIVSHPLLEGYFLSSSNEEKTEEATPHRRLEARKKGQVAKSSDLNAVLVLGAVIVVIYLLQDYLCTGMMGFMEHIYSEEVLAPLTDDRLNALVAYTFNFFIKLMAPIFIVAICIGILTNFLQVGFRFTPEVVRPKPGHINPAEGFKKILSKRALVEFAKSVLKLVLVGLVVINVVKANFDEVLFIYSLDIFGVKDFLARLIFKVGISATLIFVVLAVLDYSYQKWEFNRNLRMSRYEVKRELKQTEGDPLIKSRLKEKQRMLAMNRMMHRVPEATVVVVNPVHLAVALKYEENEMEAPQVIAKGSGYIAEKIKSIARENRIPIIENQYVARALFYQVEIGQYIPVELYQAVAEILAAIYAIKSGGGK